MTGAITKSLVDRLETKSTRYIVWDGKLPGFGIRVNANGTKTYVVGRRVGRGRSAKFKWVTIGKHGPLTPAQARERATGLLLDMADGIDPTAPMKDTARRVDTLVDQYLRSHVPTLKSASDRLGRAQRLNDYLRTQYGSWPISDVGRAEIAYLLDQASPGSARAFRSTFSHFFTWAIQRGALETNPVKNTATHTGGRGRARVLTVNDLARLWVAADAVFNPIKAGWWKVAMLTGQRRAQLVNMTWDQVSGSWWAWDGDAMKMGEPHRIPVLPAMRAVMGTVPSVQGEYIWSLNGRHPMRGFHGDKARLIAEVPDIKDWTIHDFRRSFATWCAESGGIDDRVVDAVLSHAVPGVSGIYNRAKYQRRMHEALQPWQDALVAEVAALTGDDMSEWLSTGEKVVGLDRVVG